MSSLGSENFETEDTESDDDTVELAGGLKILLLGTLQVLISYLTGAIVEDSESEPDDDEHGTSLLVGEKGDRNSQLAIGHGRKNK